ncbi:hypothetical protein EFIBHEMM_00280 [Mannheimia haemolytica]
MIISSANDYRRAAKRRVPLLCSIMRMAVLTPSRPYVVM